MAEKNNEYEVNNITGVAENTSEFTELEQLSINESYSYSFDDVFRQEDISYRHLYLNGMINEDTAGDIVYHIMRYNLMDKDIEPKKRNPIFIYINSPGGYLFEGLPLISACKLSKTPIYTVNMGKVHSMAFLIYLAGHKRFSLPYSTFLMHDGSDNYQDSSAKIMDYIRFKKKLDEVEKNFILENSKINNELYDKQYRIEWFMLPEESKTLGITDYIVGEDCQFEDILS